MINKKQERIGQTFTNKYGSKYVIIEYNNALDVVVEFQDDYKVKVHTNYKSCLTGSVRNPYDKTVCGVAYLGQGYHSTQDCGKDSRSYKLWKAMIERCYSGKSPTYNDCTVCDRWLCYSNFLQDLPLIENYDYWYNNPNKRIALDKDLKGSSKLYSLETCCFVNQSTNSIERLVRKGNPTNKRSVKAINCLTNEIKVFYSVSEASREMGVNGTHITACCKGRQKTAGGYKWSYIN